ncbi:MAG TPA: FprA family A-type flavoprotein [Clostridiales bacterium]|nr:FprA family A-type flavoprotein [Clostridiales bacterium]
MNKVELKPGIYYVGVVDWHLRNFHGYSIHRGTTYNAYLVVDEKIALIDTVKAPFAGELLDRISEIIDPASIDYVISNHVEMDHSGAIPAVMKAAPKATLVTSDPNGLKGLKAHYGSDFEFQQVKAGDVISLGKRTLTFVATPMLHWPDNMVTYCPEEKILFSNDAFGQHFTSSRHFDDEVRLSEVMADARGYYANILMPYGAQTKKALAIVEGLDIELIAPSHGIIWRSHIKEILGAYRYFSEGTTEDTALVIFDSMWHSTEKMAHSIAEGFSRRGCAVRLLDLKENDLSDVVTEVLTARYIAIGSPTLNNNILPNVAALLTYLKGLQPKNKKGFAFGSYGWGGQSIGIINSALEDLGFELLLDPVRINYLPSKEQLRELEDRVASL